MGGAWVFPGGAVDRGEGEGRRGPARRGHSRGRRGGRHRARRAPTRWSRSHAGSLRPQVKIRFDTWFFLAPLPDGAEPRVDGGEVVDARWYAPADALRAPTAGRAAARVPDDQAARADLGVRARPTQLLEHARSREIRAVEPRVVMSGEQARVLLPGEPGYDE